MSDTLKGQVEHELGDDLSRKESRRLKKEPEWSDLKSGVYPGAATACANLVRLWRREEQVDAALPAGMPLGEYERLKAKAMVVASAASDDPDVVAWRSEYLSEGFVPLDGLGKWIRSQMSPLDEGSKFSLVFPGDDGHVALIACRKGTLLGDLRYLCNGLVHDYGWAPDTATAFVVCDAVPIPPWVKVTPPAGGPHFGRRIVLDIDPDTPAEVVAGIYNDQRKAMGRAHRPPSPTTFAMLTQWVAMGCPEWEDLPLRRWDGLRADMDDRAKPLTRTTAKRGLLRAWEYLTDEPFSRN